MTFLLHAMLALLCLATPVSAQSAGSLSGSIADQTGAPLIGVRVTMRGPADRSGETGPAGHFVFQELPEGTYELLAELSGFQPSLQTVRIRAGQRATLSLVLNVATQQETIVTAAKGGARDVQDTPIAVTVVTNADLARLGTQTLADAPGLSPAVIVSQNTGYGQLTIRGIGGTNVVFAGSDPSSAVYLDGVYLARPAMVFTRFLDLERIEVLRGPQGTLYGRNAVGGAMNLISRSPTNELEASARFTAGTLGEFRGDMHLSGALKRDRVMGSIAFSRGRRDGFVRDLEHPDNPLGEDDSTAARGQLRVVFNRRTSLLLSADVDRQYGTPLTYNKVLAAKPGYQFDNPSDFHEVRTSSANWNRTRHYGASARVTTALTPSIKLVSLTAYRDLNFEFEVDSDSTELDVVTSRLLERQHQFSEEITISHEQPRLSWLGGAFFFTEDDHQTIWSHQAFAGLEALLEPRAAATSRAAFGQATVGLAAGLSATAGVRYTREHKDIDNSGGRYSLEPPNPPLPGTAYAYSDSIAHTAWTPKIGLELQLPGSALTYVSATRGFKSGGFNLSSTTTGRGYAPEWAWSYEGGLKADALGGRSRFALSAFVMDYTGLQVQTPIAVAVLDIRNAAAATIRGVEIENTSRLGGGFEAGGHFAWLDARYDRYIAVAIGGATGDVAGNRLNNAPEWSGRFWFEWTGDVGHSRRLSVSAEVAAQSTVFFTPFNDQIQRQLPYGLLGGRVEYQSASRRWTIGAYGKNLTNENYVTSTFGTPPTAFAGRPGPSRQFAIEFTVRR